jgi:hypothetical protein
MRTEVEIADGAAIADVQQASEQFTLPAARTTTGQASATCSSEGAGCATRPQCPATTGLAPHQ